MECTHAWTLLYLSCLLVSKTITSANELRRTFRDLPSDPSRSGSTPTEAFSRLFDTPEERSTKYPYGIMDVGQTPDVCRKLLQTISSNVVNNSGATNWAGAGPSSRGDSVAELDYGEAVQHDLTSATAIHVLHGDFRSIHHSANSHHHLVTDYSVSFPPRSVSQLEHYLKTYLLVHATVHGRVASEGNGKSGSSNHGNCVRSWRVTVTRTSTHNAGPNQQLPDVVSTLRQRVDMCGLDAGQSRDVTFSIDMTDFTSFMLIPKSPLPDAASASSWQNPPLVNFRVRLVHPLHTRVRISSSASRKPSLMFLQTRGSWPTRTASSSTSQSDGKGNCDAPNLHPRFENVQDRHEIISRCRNRCCRKELYVDMNDYLYPYFPNVLLDNRTHLDVGHCQGDCYRELWYYCSFTDISIHSAMIETMKQSRRRAAGVPADVPRMACSPKLNTLEAVWIPYAFTPTSHLYNECGIVSVPRLVIPNSKNGCRCA
eukprot:scpid56920/ scgid26009/ 